GGPSARIEPIAVSADAAPASNVCCTRHRDFDASCGGCRTASVQLLTEAPGPPRRPGTGAGQDERRAAEFREEETVAAARRLMPAVRRQPGPHIRGPRHVSPLRGFPPGGTARWCGALLSAPRPRLRPVLSRPA